LTALNILIEILKKRRVSVEELVNLTKLPRETVLKEIRNYGDYIRIVDDEVFLDKPIDLALALASKGVSIKELSRYLDWMDFEKVSAEILSMHRYFVKSNYRAVKPVRFEIDVIGVDIGSGRGLFVDCKHWSRVIYQKTIMDIVEKHVRRVESFIKYFNWFVDTWPYFRYLKNIIPLVITLTTPSTRVYMNTIVLSIQELNQFLLDIYSVLDIYGVKPFEVST